MASVQVLPLGNYPNQSRTLGPIDIADDVSTCDISIQRCTTATPTVWPSASTILALTPQVSQDGAVTWTDAGATVAAGDIALDRFGNELGFARSGGSLPPAINGVTRQYRVLVVITGGPLRTSATFEVN